MDYKPNILARRLVSKKKFNFAVLIPEPTEENQYWKTHDAGIKKAESEILELGVYIEKLSYNQNDPASFKIQTQKIIDGNYDGVLMVPFFKKETLELIDYLGKNKIPYVFFDTNLISDSISPLSYIGQDAFKSGYFAARLIHYIIKSNEKVLAISINTVKPEENHVNFVQREEGLKSYVKEFGSYQFDILQFNTFESNASNDLESVLLKILKSDPQIKILFITNSRAHLVAKILEKNNIRDLKMIGFDLFEENIRFLKNGYIDFLISQQPVQQAYEGIMALFNNLIMSQKVEKEILLPITLIRDFLKIDNPLF